jgi:hypothetical protein
VPAACAFAVARPVVAVERTHDERTSGGGYRVWSVGENGGRHVDLVAIRSGT